MICFLCPINVLLSSVFLGSAYPATLPFPTMNDMHCALPAALLCFVLCRGSVMRCALPAALLCFVLCLLLSYALCSACCSVMLCTLPATLLGFVLCLLLCYALCSACCSIMLCLPCALSGALSFFLPASLPAVHLLFKIEVKY
jgi:hypothetical protein